MKQAPQRMLDAIIPARRKFMPIDVFIGGNGDVVLVQEITDPKEDGYLRLIVDFDHAESLAEKINEVVRAKRESAS
ncbi:hypothetical protein [Bradyrhizobium sp. USDA 3256]